MVATLLSIEDLEFLATVAVKRKSQAVLGLALSGDAGRGRQDTTDRLCT